MSPIAEEYLSQKSGSIHVLIHKHLGSTMRSHANSFKEFIGKEKISLPLFSEALLLKLKPITSSPGGPVADTLELPMQWAEFNF